MYTCDVCLKSFKRRDNMLRHQRTLHGDEKGSDHIDSETDVTDQESQQTDSETDVSEEEDIQSEISDSADEDTWDDVVDEAFEKCQQQFQEEVKKLAAEKGDERARVHIYEDMRPIYRKAVMGIFLRRMDWFNAIRQDSIYKAIKKTARELMEIDDYGTDEAWKYATSKRKYLFDDILKNYYPPGDNSEDEESDDEMPAKKGRV